MVRQRGLAVVAVMVLVAAACSTNADPEPSGVSPTTTETVVTVGDVATQGTSGSVTVTTRTAVVTFFDKPTVREVGMWSIVPSSTLVVRGRLVGVVGHETLVGRNREVWSVDVVSTVLGTAPESGSVQVLHLDPNDPAVSGPGFSFYRQWSPGDEGIFFLTPWPIANGVVSPVLYATDLGDSGVVWSDLDRLETILGDATDLIGRGITAERRVADPSAADRRTRLAVTGRPTLQLGSGVVLGWEYVDIGLQVKEVIWFEAGPVEEAVVPEMIRVGLDQAAQVIGRSADEIYRLGQQVSDSGGTGYYLAAGSVVVSPETDRNAVVAGIEDAATQESLRQDQIRQANGARMRELVAAHGRIPFPGEKPVAEEPPKIDRAALYETPLTVDVGTRQVVFSRWFWALLEGPADVTVLENGVIIVDGPAFGDDAIMTQDVAGTFHVFDPAGNEAAQVTQEQLTAAIDDALRQASLGTVP